MEWEERMELEDLDRRLRGMPSTEQAEARLADLQEAVDTEAKEIEAKIKECRKAFKTPDLSGPERTHVAEKVQGYRGSAPGFPAEVGHEAEVRQRPGADVPRVEPQEGAVRGIEGARRGRR